MLCLVKPQSSVGLQYLSPHHFNWANNNMTAGELHFALCSYMEAFFFKDLTSSSSPNANFKECKQCFATEGLWQHLCGGVHLSLAARGRVKEREATLITVSG